MKKFKGFLSIMVILTMLCSVFCAFSVFAEEAEKSVFSAAADFSGIQGENNWYYKTQKGTEAVQDYAYFENSQSWRAGETNIQRGYITADTMMPGTNITSVFDAIRAFKAPSDGVVSITADDISAVNKKYENGKFFGVKINIKKNDEIIWPDNGAEWEELNTREAISAFNGVKIKVAADDFIYFTVRRNIDTDANNITTQGALNDNAVTFAPVITYLNGYQVSSEEFSDTQGLNGWSYYGRKQDGTLFDTSYYKYDSSQNAWISAAGGNGRGRIGADYMLPGVDTSNAISVIKEYTADAKGSVAVDALGRIGAKDTASDKAFGVKIRILKNGVTVYPTSGDWETLASRTEASVFEPFELSVNTGDKIIFEAGRTINETLATAMLYNIITWNPMIKYTSVAERKTVYSDSFENGINSDFWNILKDDDGNYKFSVENGALTGSSGWVRFYAPYAVNYSMSFDVTFKEIISSTSSGAGFFMRVRRPNDNNNGFYQLRLDTTKTTNDIVWGYADPTGTFTNSTGVEPKRLPGTTENAWKTNCTYHITFAVETDDEKDIITVSVKDNSGTVVQSGTKDLPKGTCPAGGGGFSVSSATVEIDNFVLEGEVSEGAVDTNIVFYADSDCTQELTKDIPANGMVVAAIEKTAGFDDYAECMPVTLILGAYDANGILVDANVNNAKITAGTKYVTAALTGESITSAYDYKAYLFNDLTNIMPLNESAAKLNYSSVNEKKN